MSIIMIAAPDYQEALKTRGDFHNAQIFSDTEALRALEVITRKRPDLVILERGFASTPRGKALVNRIKADPKLSSCEVHIVAHDGDYVRTAAPPAPAASEDASGTVAVATSAPSETTLDATGTRRAPRVRITDGVEVMVDGNPALLIDLSVIGAQVVSPTILRPNQRVRVVVAEGRRPIRISAGVAWAAFELAPTGPQYRAGLEFFDADSVAIEKFCAAKKKTDD